MNSTAGLGLDSNLSTNSTEPLPEEDLFFKEVESYTVYKIGEILNKYYFPVLVPIGVIGNVLSFMVMVQKQNRRSSFSWYISALAVSDTIVLLQGLAEYFTTPDVRWFCTQHVTIVLLGMLCSTVFILAMTFERFYSIIRPHKAASFNTVKRAKITILCITVFCILYNIPHLFITSTEATQCVPYSSGMQSLLGQFYYWLSFVLAFALPFISLLIMNSVIIHSLRKRSNLNLTKLQGQGQSQSQKQGQSSNRKLKTSDVQIIITLLLVTFTFLFLSTPSYIFYLYQMFYPYMNNPHSFAGFHLFYNVAQKAHFTNNGINFFLYVLSGNKFRTDLMNLFPTKKCQHKESSVLSLDTVVTMD